MGGVKSASVAQLEQQIVNNDAELRGKLEFIAHRPNLPLSHSYRARCQILRTMILKCLNQYKYKTGTEYPYAFLQMPLIVKVDVKKFQKQQAWAKKVVAQKLARENLTRLIDMGNRGYEELYRSVNGKYDAAHNSGWSNMIFSDWCRIFGAANPRTLNVLRTMTLPSIKQMLSDARAATANGEFDYAHSLVSEAASEMRRANGIVKKYFDKVVSGGAQAEFAIKFYAAVAMSGAASGYNAVNAFKLTTAEKALVGFAGEGAFQSTHLLTKSQNEEITAKEFAEAMFQVGMSAATPFGEDLLGKVLTKIAPGLATRMATKAVDRYIANGNILTPNTRRKVIENVADELMGRIVAVGMKAVGKSLGQVTDFPNEPNWNFWENVFAPLVSGNLGAVVNAAARKADSNKATVPQ